MGNKLFFLIAIISLSIAQDEIVAITASKTDDTATANCKTIFKDACTECILFL